MKLISCIVFSVILAPLVCCAPAPQTQGAIAAAAAAQPIMNAQTVNGGIAFTQQFMQLLSMLFNNFNAIVPRFVNLFTGQNQAPIPSAGQGIPSLANIPGMPSLPSMQAGQPSLAPAQTGQRPEKFNKQPKDTELNSDNDTINDSVDILSI